MEVRRQITGGLLQEGMGIRQVARLVGVSPALVFRWKKTLEEGGKQALVAKPHSEGPPRLTAEQKEGLKAALLLGPRATGFSTDLWTPGRVAQVIQSHYGVRYHPGRV